MYTNPQLLQAELREFNKRTGLPVDLPRMKKLPNVDDVAIYTEKELATYLAMCGRSGWYWADGERAWEMYEHLKGSLKECNAIGTVLNITATLPLRYGVDVPEAWIAAHDYTKTVFELLVLLGYARKRLLGKGRSYKTLHDRLKHRS